MCSCWSAARRERYVERCSGYISRYAGRRGRYSNCSGCFRRYRHRYTRRRGRCWRGCSRYLGRLEPFENYVDGALTAPGTMSGVLVRALERSGRRGSRYTRGRGRYVERSSRRAYRYLGRLEPSADYVERCCGYISRYRGRRELTENYVWRCSPGPSGRRAGVRERQRRAGRGSSEPRSLFRDRDLHRGGGRERQGCT